MPSHGCILVTHCHQPPTVLLTGASQCLRKRQQQRMSEGSQCPRDLCCWMRWATTKPASSIRNYAWLGAQHVPHAPRRKWRHDRHHRRLSAPQLVHTSKENLHAAGLHSLFVLLNPSQPCPLVLSLQIAPCQASRCAAACTPHENAASGLRGPAHLAFAQAGSVQHASGSAQRLLVRSCEVFSVDRAWAELRD